MTPSWYDVLDVDASASTEEIRSAWKSAIAELDPTDRRFRLLNQAAETLLAPTRRAEHDAALAADVGEAGGEDGGEEDGEDDVEEPSAARAGVPQTDVVTLDKPRSSEAATSTTTGTAPARAWWQPPAWLIVGVAIVAVALAVLAALQFAKPSDTAVESDTRGAQTAAERAAQTVLSYDYRDLDANEKASAGYLTPAYRTEFEKLFVLIKENAASIKPVVSAQVIASGIQRVSTTGDRVSVLVFVNRPTINAATTTPKVYRDPVLMRMVKVDGDWLVDDMITTPVAQ